MDGWTDEDSPFYCMHIIDTSYCAIELTVELLLSSKNYKSYIHYFIVFFCPVV